MSFFFFFVSCFFLRWNKWKYDQWWEVKFVGEGIIDQGGGFRDSLAEISDELCPIDDNIPEILPYFIKTPNHKVYSLVMFEFLFFGYMKPNLVSNFISLFIYYYFF